MRRSGLTRWQRAGAGATRLVSVLTAVLVTGSAGAYVPGSGASRGRLPSAAATAEPASAADFENMLTGLDDKGRMLRQEIEDTHTQLDIAERRMKARGRAFYQLVRAGLLPIGGGFDALVDHATKMERIRMALERDLNEQAECKKRLKTLQARLQRLQAERGPLELQERAMQQARSTIKQADDRRAAFDRAFGSTDDGSPDSHVAIYGAGSGAPSGAGYSTAEGFAGLRGRLSFPLAGRTEAPTSHAPRVGGGMEFVASSDTLVHAVYAGTVTFVGRYGGHGLTVMLDHGDKYSSLYGNLQRTKVRVGDAVPERGLLGKVRRRGRSSPKLYFELRHGRTRLDPGPWLGL